MAKNPAHNKANTKYRRDNYDQIVIRVSKGRRGDLQAAAQAAGAGSVSAWLLGLAERETGLDLVLRGQPPHWPKSAEDAADGDGK